MWIIHEGREKELLETTQVNLDDALGPPTSDLLKRVTRNGTFDFDLGTARNLASSLSRT